MTIPTIAFALVLLWRLWPRPAEREEVWREKHWPVGREDG